MDISSVTGQSNIGGISQPVIGQRKIEHEIRLKEGEVNILGGILEDQDIRSLNGIPGLAQIPILKYLFSQTNVEHKENEIVFALIPHIIRARDVTDLNEKALEVGTASAIELRRASQAPPPAPANEAAPSGTLQRSSPPARAGASAAPQTACRRGQLCVRSASLTQARRFDFRGQCAAQGAQNVYSVPLQVSYDPKVLQVVNVSNGGLLSQDGQAVALVHRDDDTTGTLQITATRPPGAAGISGQGAVVTLTFLAKGSGQSTLTISKGGARDPAMQAMPVAGAVATVTVQ